MEAENVIPPVDDQAAFELGEMLGRRQAFGALAGRCSAADAECLRRMRDQKLYASRAETWNDFCPKYLGLSSRNANRIIRNLEEFGPGYFEVAQLTRITASQYRVLAPQVRDQQIYLRGGPIALIPENAEKVAAAVADLRREASEPPPAIERDRLAALNRRCELMVRDLQLLVDAKPHGADRLLLRCAIQETIVILRALDLQLGL